MSELAALYREHLDYVGDGYGRALSEQGYDALVVHSGVAVPKSSFDDQDWPLVVTPTFAHWLALAEPDAVVVVVPGTRPRLIRTVVTDFWDGAAPVEAEDQLGAFEITLVSEAGDLGAELPRGRIAFVGDDRERAQAWGIDAGRINPAALLAALEPLRAHKSEYERACIARANQRAARGHRRLAEAFAAGDCSELALHLEYLAATEQDATQTPYKNIVALGAHAAVLHHVHYGRAPARGDGALLVDAGASYRGYASDITRTTVRGRGAAAERFRQLVAGVEALQQRMCAALRPGVGYEDLHDQAHRLLAEVLVEVGLGRGSADELTERGVTRRFFPHGLGHSLGLQVHDVGCRPREPKPENPFLRATCRVEAGHVFTIEPGCYFIEPLLDALRADSPELVDWALVDQLRPFGGVRIEDDVAALPDGPRNLTREAWAQG